MPRIKIDKITRDEKCFFLGYDSGLEHGPMDFNIHNMDPEYIMHIAASGKFTGLVLHKGLAEMYQENFYKKVPLILKLNASTNIAKTSPIASQVCSVKKAVKLNAAAVGYTINIGSANEHEIFKEFGKIQEEAHDYSLPVIAWVLPGGRFVPDEYKTSMLAYAARSGLELGADMSVINYNGLFEEYKWVVKCAGNSKVLVNDSKLRSDNEILKRVHDTMTAGVTGIIAGKEIWQHKSPMKMAEAMEKIVFYNKDVEEALKLL